MGLFDWLTGKKGRTETAVEEPLLESLVAGDCDSLTVVISRKDIEARDPSETLHTLRQLLGSRSIAEKLQGQVELSVHGYDSDPRELYEIAEVRTFFRQLDDAFPFWFYFLSTYGESFLLVLAFCLCRVTKMGPGLAMIDPGDLQEFLEVHYGAMNHVCDKLGISKSSNARVSADIERYFGEAFGSR